jgi:hypothetical protein
MSRRGYLPDRSEVPDHRRYLRAPMLDALLTLVCTVAAALRPRWALLGEIALLRHQLTVLQRSVARPRLTRFDRIVGRARHGHPDLDERPAHRPTRDASSLASRRLQGSLAVAEPSTPDIAPRSGDARPDPVHGLGEQTLGRREDPRRVAQAGRQGQQTYHPEVHAGGAAPRAARAALVRVFAKPRPGDLGLRLSAGPRRVLPSDLRVCVHRARHPQGRVRGDDALPIADVGDAAASLTRRPRVRRHGS